MDESHKDQPQEKKPALWKSKSLLIAVGITCVGLFMWHPWISEPAAKGTLPAGVSSFAESASAGTTAEAPASTASPAVFRFGASYLAGFFLGWFCRKSMKIGLLLGGAAVIMILLLQHYGNIDLDWATIQGHITQSLAWLHGELGALKDFVTGYLPSTGAGVVGMIMGVRRG